MYGQVRQTDIAVALNNEMKQFKNAIPMIVSLKNEAFTQRHWTMLMDKTGVKFDMKNNDLTLSSIFAMNLHKEPVNWEMQTDIEMNLSRNPLLYECLIHMSD